MGRGNVAPSFSHEERCLVCGSPHLNIFFEMNDVPVYCNVLWPDQESARHCPRGDIKLAFCKDCSFIANVAFDPSRLDYTQAYENTLSFSPHFRRYAHSQAARLIKTYDLYQKNIMEIGCGNGDFLLMLCKLGNNRGIGFDPAYVEREKRRKNKKTVQFIRDYYSEKYKDYKADLIVCRHMLEHVNNPKTFLETIRKVIGTNVDTHVFFEVPNATNIFQKFFIWDIIYEHFSYFTPSSLERVFSSCGFQVEKLTEEYKGQFLCVDAKPNNKNDLKEEYDINKIAQSIESFRAVYAQKIKEWRSRLEKIKEEKGSAVIWGAGSKGVTFLNVLKNIMAVNYAVDINPRKQGMYIPGTGQKIVSPNFLKGCQPDVVIVMNPVYMDEIRDTISKLDIVSTLVPIEFGVIT